MSDLYGYMDNWRKAKNGQVFTPLHMGLFAADLIGVSDDDVVLDACCGSGALLYAAYERNAAKVLGIEFDADVLPLAIDNFKELDIPSEFISLDAMSCDAADWIKKKKPTKVLLNPPYERKYGCTKIIKNVLNALEPGTKVGIFVPDKKFEKESKKYKKELNEKHCIDKIIKMPQNLFYGFSVEVSLFIITAGKPQKEEIYTCYINDDGFVSVKNKSPQDLKGIWKNKKRERYYKAISCETTDTATAKELDAKYVKADSCLSYRLPEKPFEISEEDFEITALNYLLFKQGMSIKDFGFNELNHKTLNIFKLACAGIKAKGGVL